MQTWNFFSSVIWTPDSVPYQQSEINILYHAYVNLILCIFIYGLLCCALKYSITATFELMYYIKLFLIL